MAILTPITLADAIVLGARFGVQVTAFRPVPEGSVNTNGVLTAKGGTRWFLRVYEEQTPETARHEAAVLTSLAAAGVPTPTPLPLASGGGAIAEHLGKPVAVFPFVDGDVVCQPRVTAARVREVGAGLGRVHEAGREVLEGPLGSTIGRTRFGPHALLRRLDAVAAGSPPPHVAAVLPALAKAAADRLAALAGGEEGYVHGDLFRDNVLFRGDTLTALLDFESASRGPLAFDLAVTLLAWCFGDDLDLDLGRALIDGYRSRRAVTAATRAALWDEAHYACTRFTTTRITDFELRSAAASASGDQAPVRHKDFRRWIARRDALTRIGRSRLDEALFA
jgi:homoserine kinase type II